MSASEKMKATDGKFELLRTDDLPPPTIYLKFWPQLVALVEAAERMPELRYSNEQPSLTAAWSVKDLRAALAALDEALP